MHLTKPSQATTWLPIATAPRDGRNILLRFGVDGVSQARFIPGLPHPWRFIDTSDGITWLINSAVDGPGGPSHWQPMPGDDLPTGQEQAGAVANDGQSLLQDLHNELYLAQRTESVEVLMDSIGKARLLLARYRDSLNVGSREAVDLIARGMTWADTEKHMRDACAQAGVQWDEEKEPQSIAINVMQRLANAAHKTGFQLALDRLAATGAKPTKEQIQSAFEAWVSQACPSGDVSDVQRQWEASSDYGDLYRQEAPVASGEVPKWIDDPHDIEQGQMLNPAWLKLHRLTPAQAAEEATSSAEAPSEKQKKLLDLADRIDHEQLWRWAGMDHHKMTPEQRDRMNAGVALRRYARLWAPGHWVVFPPVGPVSFSASTLDKAVEMATRDDARRSDAGTRRAAAAPEPDDTPLETGEGDAR